MEKFEPKDLHDYPPRITCTIYPEGEDPKRTTCCMSLSGLKPDVKVYIQLRVPMVQFSADTRDPKPVDTKILLVSCSVSWF